jgi:AcrR family transcriptional regulator
VTSPALEPARRGRPPKLNRQAVVEAALSLVESEGYDAISVRRLAAELGVSTFAVQSHMGSKDELLDDVVRELLAVRPTGVQTARSLRQALLRYATTMWELVLEHPRVLEVLERHITSPESVLRDLDRIALLAERDGMTASDLAEVYETVWAFVLGYAATVHARRGIDETGARSERAAEIADDLPHAASLAAALSAQDRLEAFPLRLAALVDALVGR